MGAPRSRAKGVDLPHPFSKKKRKGKKRRVAHNCWGPKREAHDRCDVFFFFLFLSFVGVVFIRFVSPTTTTKKKKKQQ